MAALTLTVRAGLFTGFCVKVAATGQQQGNLLATNTAGFRHKLSQLLLLILCSVVLLPPGFAAENQNPVPLLQPLTTAQGLSSGAVNKVIIDHSGFLWLATDRGLNRFDANQVRQLPLVDDSQVELNVSAVLEDSQRRLFVAAQQQGLYLLDRNTAAAELLTPLQQLESDTIPLLHDVIEQQPDL